MEKPYSEIDHDHCWQQGKSPACGQKIEHAKCCLCGILKRISHAKLPTPPSLTEEIVEQLQNELFKISHGDMNTMLNMQYSILKKYITKVESRTKEELAGKIKELMPDIQDWSEDASYRRGTLSKVLSLLEPEISKE